MRTQINPAIESSLKKRLLKTAQQKQIPYGSIVETALKAYLDPENLAEKEKILYRRLDQITRKLDNLALEGSVFAEAFLLFVKTYLSRLPEVPPDQKKALKAQSVQKFQQFLTLLSENVSMEHSILHYLPKDEITSDINTQLKQAGACLPETLDEGAASDESN